MRTFCAWVKPFRFCSGISAVTKLQEGLQAEHSGLPIPVIDPGQEEQKDIHFLQMWLY